MKGYLLLGPVPPFQGGDVWLTCHLGLGAVRLTPGYHIPGFQPPDVAPIRGIACLTAVRQLGICLPWGSAHASRASRAVFGAPAERPRCQGAPRPLPRPQLS